MVYRDERYGDLFSYKDVLHTTVEDHIDMSFDEYTNVTPLHPDLAEITERSPVHTAYILSDDELGEIVFFGRSPDVEGTNTAICKFRLLDGAVK